MAIARYVGIGVSEYDKGHDQLDHAVPEAKAFGDWLRKLSSARYWPIPASRRPVNA